MKLTPREPTPSMVDVACMAVPTTATLSDAARCIWQAMHDAAPSAEPMADEPVTRGHCSAMRQPGGCPLHNLECGYPECDTRPAAQEPVADEPEPNYSEMSREQLERHTVRLAQASRNALDFWHRHALGPLQAPSCLCCGKLPEQVAIQHTELPGVVICKPCRDAATRAALEPGADEPVAWRYRYSTKGRWQYADDPANDPAVIEEPLYTRPAAAPAERGELVREFRATGLTPSEAVTAAKALTGERGEYPPLPEPAYQDLECEYGEVPEPGAQVVESYTADQMRAYVDADRAQRVPPLVSGDPLWLWSDGDRLLAYRHKYPCYSPGGDPMTLGEPVCRAEFRESHSRRWRPSHDRS